MKNLPKVIGCISLVLLLATQSTAAELKSLQMAVKD